MFSFNFFSKKRRILTCRFNFISESSEKNDRMHVILNSGIVVDREYDIHTNKEKIKKKEYDRVYRIQNKEKIKESYQKYIDQNKEKLKEYKREYYLQNKQMIQENNREYRIQNADKIKESKREYINQNKDKLKKSYQEYYLQNKDKKKEYDKEYRSLKEEKIKEYSRKYRIQNKGKIKESLRTLTIKKNIERNNGIYLPLNSWKTSESVRHYFEEITPLLHINDLSDWYRISRSQIIEKKGRGMFAKYKSLGHALKVAYPDYDWDLSKFSLRGKKSTQRWLYVKLKKLLPNTEIVEEYHHPELLWEDDIINKPIQFDIWVPEYKLALEYQGEHHYFDIHGAFGPGSTTQIFNERDEKKKQICASKGIKLVCIPYWWDGQENSLSSTLHAILPDVFNITNSPPIPTNLPDDHAKKSSKD